MTGADDGREVWGELEGRGIVIFFHSVFVCFFDECYLFLFLPSCSSAPISSPNTVGIWNEIAVLHKHAHTHTHTHIHTRTHTHTHHSTQDNCFLFGSPSFHVSWCASTMPICVWLWRFMFHTDVVIVAAFPGWPFGEGQGVTLCMQLFCPQTNAFHWVSRLS